MCAGEKFVVSGRATIVGCWCQHYSCGLQGTYPSRSVWRRDSGGQWEGNPRHDPPSKAGRANFANSATCVALKGCRLSFHSPVGWVSSWIERMSRVVRKDGEGLRIDVSSWRFCLLCISFTRCACWFVSFFLYFFLCLFACLFVCLFLFVYVCFCFCLFVFVCVCVCVCLFVRSFVRSFVCLFVCLFLCFFVSLFLCFCISLFLCFFVSVFLCFFVSLFLCFCVSLFLCFSVSLFLCFFVCFFVSLFISFFLCLLFLFVCLFVCWDVNAMPTACHCVLHCTDGKPSHCPDCTLAQVAQDCLKPGVTQILNCRQFVTLKAAIAILHGFAW